MAENLFVRMGGNGGSKVCDIVGSYLLSQLTHLSIKFGLNRDTALFVRTKQSHYPPEQVIEEWRTHLRQAPNYGLCNAMVIWAAVLEKDAVGKVDDAEEAKKDISMH